ncbi:DUF6978 family protein [Levilactobacillus wangkuiensis]|uniref:DUF6978 family protein n=1 Tax=Levilactobacillus wangkuiensis TaxID=2799566 RepID=UPI001951A722|nr:hypothetical protein [Levilactobacillus wangkuiensis]
MENPKYQKLHNYPKTINRKKIFCAAQGEQRFINGHATFNADEEFKVIQVRKGRIRKEDLTYVLMYKNIMLRIDLIGATHHGIPTPHVHIFDDAHDNGRDVISLSDVNNYDPTTDVVGSLASFLRYNNFDLTDVSISPVTA